MTKFLTKAALAATVALFATPAMAADTKPFTATARIVSPLTLTFVNNLNFGTITMLSGLTTADVVVGANGGANACGTNLNCTAPTPARFTVTGSNNEAVRVDLDMPTNPGQLRNGANFVSFTPTPVAPITLNGTGDGAFEVGGTITVLGSTLDGTYTNDVNVTVEYN